MLGGSVRTATYLAALATLLAGPAHVRAQRLNIRTYTGDDGLPQGQVYSIYQDSRGYIWVATNAGVARYDGRQFHRITSSEGLASNTVEAIESAPGGGILATTADGVCRVDDERVQCFATGHRLPGGQAEMAVADADGDIWFASDAGVSLIRGDSVVRTFGTRDGLPASSALTLSRDAHGILWVGTTKGLARFDGDRWKAVSLSHPEPTVYTLVAGPEGLLAGTDRGLFQQTGDTFLRFHLGQEIRAEDVSVGPDSTVWIGTTGRLIRYRAGTATAYTPANGIPTQELWDLKVDREGNVWLGSDQGLAKLVPGPFTLYTDRQGLPHPFVRAIVEDSTARVWFGTRDGLAFWRNGHIEEAPFRGLVPDDRIFALAPVPGGGLMVGTAQGMFYISREGRLRPYGRSEGLPYPQVSALVSDGSGGLWVGTRLGVVKWIDGKVVPAGIPALAKAHSMSLARDSVGRLWVGLISGGLLVVHGDSVRALDGTNGLSSETIWTLAADRRGGVWAGSNGDGAFHVTSSGIRRVTKADGLGDNFIWDIVVDHRGAVWMFTGNGLNRLHGSDMRYFGPGDGLEDLEGSAGAGVAASNGDLWFGVGSGVYRYQPALDHQIPVLPRIYLEGITVAGKPLARNVRALGPQPGAVTFRFSVPSYRDERAIRFRYRLANMDDTWSAPSPDPTITFAGLPAGRHRLEAMAEKDRGTGVSEVTSVPFTVRAAFWQTAWFRILVALAASGLVFLVPFVRSRHLEVERKRLEEVVRERTSEIQEKKRRLEEEVHEREGSERERVKLQTQLWEAQKMEAVGRLAGGIAHDFNNLLTSVLGHAELLAEDVPEGSEVREGLTEIRTSAARGAHLVSQLLAFSRRQVVAYRRMELTDVVNDALEVVGRLLSARARVSVELPDEPAWVRGDPNQIRQVVVNLCMNAVDAMPVGGQLRVAVEPRSVDGGAASVFNEPVPAGQYHGLVVEDTGVGMAPETLARAFEPFFTTKSSGSGSGMGLASVYGIAHQLGGYIQVASTPGSGTVVTLLLPEDGA